MCQGPEFASAGVRARCLLPKMGVQKMVPAGKLYKIETAVEGRNGCLQEILEGGSVFTCNFTVETKSCE
jgi:hypothetical protein